MFVLLTRVIIHVHRELVHVQSLLESSSVGRMSE